MGRADPSQSTQHQQGLQFQELNRNQSPETIDRSPPPPPPFVPNDDPPKKTDQPQAFPPPQHETPQAFPPQHEMPQAFPPAQGSHFQHQQNVGMQQPFQQQQQGFYQQQPQGFQYQPPPQKVFHQPVAGGGVPMGHPIAQPSPYLQPPVPTEPWKTGLFDCMNDPQNAIITACFPCVTFGQIAEILDSGNTSCGTSGMLYGLIACCLGVPCIMSCSYRTKLRSRYGLIESPAPDWVVHCLLEWCALCQEYRELKERGVDPAIGWHANLARQQQYPMAPPMQQRMM